MIASSNSPTSLLERRSSNPSEWLHTLCHEFSEATGWELKFLELNQHPPSQDQQLDWCWHSDVSDGSQRFGTIFLEVPQTEIALTHNSAFKLAELFHGQVSTYLRLHRQAAQQAEEIAALIGGERQSPGDNFANRLKALLRATATLSNFRSVALFILDPSGDAVRLRFAHQIHTSAVPTPVRSFVEAHPDLEALRSGHCVVRRGEYNCDADWLPRDANIGVCIPVQNDSGPVGTLWLYDRRNHSLSKQDVELLSGFGSQIADSFERLVLLKDSETKERLTRELDVIATAAAECLSSHSDLPGCEVAFRCCSHHEVGGDLCEVIAIDEHRTLFVVGDASGDSIPAAVVMTATRGALHALLSAHREVLPPPNEIIGGLNQAVVKVTGTQQFMSLILGVFDSRTQKFTYSNAGHPPPLFVQKHDTKVLRSLGMVLGVIESASYGLDEIELEPTDYLILVSDGILEARDADGNMFRNDGVIRSLTGIVEPSAEAVLDVIWKRFEQYTDGLNSDDRTLLVMRPH